MEPGRSNQPREEVMKGNLQRFRFGVVFVTVVSAIGAHSEKSYRTWPALLIAFFLEPSLNEDARFYRYLPAMPERNSR